MSPKIAALLVLPLLQDSGGEGPSPRIALTPLAYYQEHQRARELYASREWVRAVPVFEHLVASSPWDGEAWRRLAMGRYYLHDHTGAIQAFERTLELGFGSAPRVQYNLACCYALNGDVDSAFARIASALSSRLEGRSDLRADSDLVGLHADPRWSAMVGAPGERSADRDEGWRGDLDFLVAEAQRLHAGPARPAFSKAFVEGAAVLRAAIPGLSDEQVLARMNVLVAILDDGHSAIYGPGPDSELEVDRRVLPFRFYLFPEGLYVVDGDGEWARHAGSRVARFGDVPAEEVLRRMSVYRGADNPMTWRWMGPQFYVRGLAMLRVVGVSVDGGSVPLALVQLDGSEQMLEVEAGDFDLVRKLRPSPAATGEVPRYLSAVDVHYWTEALPEHGALYFQFNQVRDAPQESIAELAGRLREALSPPDVTTLIVDVRHNSGGNNSLVRPLVRAVIEFEMSSPDHRVFVITGRNTFSAAQNFINRLERWTDCVFVGEPSSSCPNFVGEETELVLPYSDVRGSISTHYWQDSDPGDDRAWIAPDVPVELTATDYFTNVDPALEAVLAILETR